jgi:hypothetical protein
VPNADGLGSFSQVIKKEEKITDGAEKNSLIISQALP